MSLGQSYQDDHVNIPKYLPAPDTMLPQYFQNKAKEHEELNRKLTKQEYEEIESYLYDVLELENGYIQELGEHEEEYVPKWEF